MKPLEPDSCSFELSFTSNSYIINQNKIERLSLTIRTLLGLEDYPLDIQFVSPEEITQLNLEYRQKNKSTDVLSFPQQEFAKPILCEEKAKSPPKDAPPQLLGDIAISLDNALENAHDIGQDLDREVCFLLVHGILHLCGHDHMEANEEEIMLKQQSKIMSALEDSEPPPSIWNNCVRLKV